MRVGTHVEVRNRFDARWSRGFEVAEQVREGPAHVRYKLRRRSDGAILPAFFEADDLREEHRRQTWWIG
jgi:hypothetical protein